MNTPRYRLWKNKRISEGKRASWVDPETDYGSPAWREKQSKKRLAMYADPKKGPALREKQSKANYGPAGPPGETKDEKRARVELSLIHI